MFSADERAAIEVARVGRLATADVDGRPNVVPVCFATIEADDGELSLVTPIDEKPKTVRPSSLRRVRDIGVNPRVAVVVDHYAEEWDRLGWVQIRGTARLIKPDDEGHVPAIAALRTRYRQYEDQALEERPVIGIAPGVVRSWGNLTSFSG